MVCIQQFKLLNLLIDLFYDLLQPLQLVKNTTNGCENKPAGFENRNCLLRLA